MRTHLRRNITTLSLVAGLAFAGAACTVEDDDPDTVITDTDGGTTDTTGGTTEDADADLDADVTVEDDTADTDADTDVDG